MEYVDSCFKNCERVPDHSVGILLYALEINLGLGIQSSNATAEGLAVKTNVIYIQIH